jgi:hypothetical protein
MGRPCQLMRRATPPTPMTEHPCSHPLPQHRIACTDGARVGVRAKQTLTALPACGMHCKAWQRPRYWLCMGAVY